MNDKQVGQMVKILHYGAIAALVIVAGIVLVSLL